MSFETADAAETAFYAAFESLDLTTMDSLWAPSAICVHPGGPLLRGHDAVQQSWAEIFASADPPRIEFEVLHRTVSAELAVHVVEERIYANRSTSSKPAPVLATNTYVRRDGTWQMVAHHASLPLLRSAARREAAQLH